MVVGPSRQIGHARLETADVAQRGGHQQELCLRQLQQRHLPGPAALRVGIEMELVHDDGAQVRRRTFAQRNVGQDLGRAADDRGVLVHAGVAGDHADVLRSEDLAEGEELFRDQGLDGGRVVAPLATGHRLEVGRNRHERLARAGGRREDHVGSGGQLHDGLVLGRVQLEAAAFGPLDEPFVERVRVRTGPVVIRADGAGSCSTSFIAFQLSASASRNVFRLARR